MRGERMITHPVQQAQVLPCNITEDALAAVHADLRETQKSTVAFAERRIAPGAEPFRACLIAHRTGMGKTLTCIFLAMREWLRSGRASLFVCNNAAQQTCAAEVARIEARYGVRIGCVPVDRGEARASAPDPYVIYMCTYTHVTNAVTANLGAGTTTGNSVYDAELLRAHFSRRSMRRGHRVTVGRAWPIIFFDEMHILRNGTGPLAGKACLALSSEARVGITATPAVNAVEDMVNLIAILGGRGAAVADWAATRDAIMVRDTAAVHPGVRVFRKTLVLEPSPEVRAFEAALAAHRSLGQITNFVRTITNIAPAALAHSETRGIVDALAAIGIARNELRAAPWAAARAPKIRAAVKICRRHADARVVIFSHFYAPLLVMRDALAGAGFAPPPIYASEVDINERNRLQRFAASAHAPRVMLCTTGSGSESMSMTAYSVVIFLAPPSASSLETQAVGRVFRSGQTRDVFVYELTVRDSPVDRRGRELRTKRSAAVALAVAGVAGDAAAPPGHAAAGRRACLASFAAAVKWPPAPKRRRPAPGTTVAELLADAAGLLRAAGGGVFAADGDGDPLPPERLVARVAAAPQLPGLSDADAARLTPVPDFLDGVAVGHAVRFT